MLRTRREPRHLPSSNCRSTCTRILSITFLAVFIAIVYFRIHSESNDQDDETLKGKCTVYSPAYPSAGGPGCSPRCVSSDGHKNSSYSAGFHSTTHKWPEELTHNMHRAADILKKHGPVASVDTERSIYLHVSFNYYCCYNQEEGAKIGKFLRSYDWKPHSVYFDRMVCAVHGHGDMVSIILMFDQPSQTKLLHWALQSERDMESHTGVRKHIPHTQLQDFHMTLGTVNQSLFPVQAALEEINRVIPPNTWNTEPVVLHTPVCNKCLKAIAELEGV